MPNFQVDLTNCDLEPIHIPGQIQSHGFMVVINNYRDILFCSENIENFIDSKSVDLLGRSITDLESIIAYLPQPEFITNMLNLGKGANKFEQSNPFEFNIADLPYYLIISISDGYYVLEFEPAASKFSIDVQKMLGRTISEMLSDKNLKSVVNNAAIQVKNIIQFDRVMIYKFADDGHGEVVAEAKNDDLDPWLGLHYPASDIPKQARELYKINLTRLIANVNTTPSKIITSSSYSQTLDLTYSQLRAVSPIHIQYLKNMGVASSFSISLMYKDELWGLIACHNYTPQFIDYKSRESAKLIGQILSSALEYRQDEENQLVYEGFDNSLDKITKYLQQYDSVEEALTLESINILDVINATGAVLVLEKGITKIGITPDDDQLINLISWIQENIAEVIFETDSLPSLYPEAAAFKEVASGMIVCIIAKELKEYIIWFKPEYLQQVKWAGNPDKPVEFHTDGLPKISPRHSFEVWTETVASKSDKWSKEELKAVARLKEEINESLITKSAAIRLLNEKLKEAYEELDTFSYTISHDLKNPLAVIKSYAQLLGRSKTLQDREKGYAIRIEDRALKMNQMIKEVLDYSRIGRSDIVHQQVDTGTLITEIITDLKMVYDMPALEIIVGETPEISGDQTMLSQVFSNLIGNAVKYSQLAASPLVKIHGEVNEAEVCYHIEDNGIGIEAKDLSKVFELFNRLDNVQEIEGSGVGLAIVKRIVDKHQGRIWLESEIGKGTTFFVAFHK